MQELLGSARVLCGLPELCGHVIIIPSPLPPSPLQVGGIVGGTVLLRLLESPLLVLPVLGVDGCLQLDRGPLLAADGPSLRFLLGLAPGAWVMPQAPVQAGIFFLL